MNGEVSDYVVGNWLKSFTPAFFALHVTNPGRTGGLQSEVIGGSYKRLSGAFTVADARTVWLATKLTWTGLPAVTISYVAVWDALVNGQLLSAGPLPPPYPNLAQGGSFALDAFTYAISVGVAA